MSNGPGIIFVLLRIILWTVSLCYCASMSIDLDSPRKFIWHNYVPRSFSTCRVVNLWCYLCSWNSYANPKISHVEGCYRCCRIIFLRDLHVSWSLAIGELVVVFAGLQYVCCTEAASCVSTSSESQLTATPHILSQVSSNGTPCREVSPEAVLAQKWTVRLCLCTVWFSLGGCFCVRVRIPWAILFRCLCSCTGTRRVRFCYSVVHFN